MMWVDVLSRIVHVSTAIVLIGGSVFNLFVVLPALRNQAGDEAWRPLGDAMIARWKSFVHIGVVLFLVTGFYNYVQAMPLHRGDGLYHALVGTKILLALFVFFVAAALVGRSQRLEKMRQNRAFWLRMLVLVAAVIVSISGFVKIRGGNPPVQEMLVEELESSRLSD